MARYIITGSYTSQGLKGMMARPSDRAAETAALVEAAGGKMEAYFITTGDTDFLMVIQAPDGANMLQGIIVAGSTGAVTGLKTTMAFTSAEFMAAQKRASEIASKFTPAG